jgi:hypothetical protein
MKYFYIESSSGVYQGNEYKLHDPDGKIFFIVREKFGKQHLSCISKYDIINNQLKDWVIQNKDRKDQFLFNEIILPMFRDQKINELLNG